VKSNALLDKSYAFALSNMKLTFELQEEIQEFVITRQVIRSGAAIGALSEEAQEAESKADFVRKLAIANKEAHETHYWLRLMRDSSKFPRDYELEISQCEDLKRLLISIIKSAKS